MDTDTALKTLCYERTYDKEYCIEHYKKCIKEKKTVEDCVSGYVETSALISLVTYAYDE